MADPWELATFGLAAATFSVFLLALLYLRWVIPRVVVGFSANLSRSLFSWAFDAVDETAADGSTKKVLKPSARLTALVDNIAPILIQRGIAWAKTNIKLGGGGGGEGGGAIGPEAILNMIPKQYRGIASMLLPYAAKFMGGKGPGEKKAGEAPPNAFRSQP